MLRVLWAFAWLRWRVLVNSLERTGARDTIERLSLAIEQLGPLLALAMLVPSALTLAGLSTFTGYDWASTGTAPPTFTVLRYLLLAASVLCIVGPLLLPGNEQMNAVRLLLLPIPRGVLYVAQGASRISEPWILLLLPIVAFLPAGMIAGGAPAAGLLALVTGLLLVAALIGLSSAATAAIQLVTRDRRRAELLALLFILVLPIAGVLPGLLEAQSERAARGRDRASSERVLPGWARGAAARVYAMTPSELFTRATREAVGRRTSGAVASILGLAAVGLAFHVSGFVVFGRLLDSPSSTSPRRTAASGTRWGLTVPGVSPGTSAVALAQVRLALRSPRGRSVLISPLVMFFVFAVVMRRSGGDVEFGFLKLTSGPALATFGAALSLLVIQPFAVNQFAIDGAGLTLAFLSPLSDRELLIGKAIGNAAIGFAPALVCTSVAFLFFPAGEAALWVSVPLGACATYLLAAPAAAALSAAFPRAVDLNSVGRGSNAHGAAGLLGIVAFALAGAPAIGLTVIFTRVLERTALLPLALLVACAVSLVVSAVLFRLVERLVAVRRENLALVA